MLAEVFAPTPALRNDGTAALRHVGLYNAGAGSGVLGVGLRATGTTTVAASVLTGCAGTLPTSLGANAEVGTTCGLVGPGDVEPYAPDFVIDLSEPVAYTLPVGSPLVDAVPVGTSGCGSPSTVDLRGAPRPVDGDGDGTAACDIGAVERPAE